MFSSRSSSFRVIVRHGSEAASRLMAQKALRKTRRGECCNNIKDLAAQSEARKERLLLNSLHSAPGNLIVHDETNQFGRMGKWDSPASRRIGSDLRQYLE